MARRFHKSKKDIGLNITSMMDMFTIMLVFMLKNFSAEGSILTNADNLTLPYSTSKNSPREISISMVVANDWIIIDNAPIVPTPQVRNQESVVVERIKQRMLRSMEQEENMVRVGALSRVKGEVIIQIDKNIDFDVVYKTMASCGQAGYTNIRLAVMSKDQD